MNAPNRIRSTTAPDTRAVVMMQNVAWKAKNTRCGIVPPSRGAKDTSARKAWSRPPTTGLVPSKASEYPTTAHVTVAIAIAATHIMKVLSVFLDRTSPA